MNYTTNYHLPQWVETDRIMMEDFNAAMSNIDRGIADAQVGAEELSYVTGSYTGNGVTQTIELGFQPSFLLINRENTETLVPTTIYTNPAITGANVNKPTLLLTETGFQILTHENVADLVNMAGYTYSYIAFQ